MLLEACGQSCLRYCASYSYCCSLLPVLIIVYHVLLCNYNINSVPSCFMIGSSFFCLFFLGLISCWSITRPNPSLPLHHEPRYWIAKYRVAYLDLLLMRVVSDSRFPIQVCTCRTTAVLHTRSNIYIIPTVHEQSASISSSDEYSYSNETRNRC